MATIEEVAKLAGVSVATVSRVINKKNNVTKNTQNNVMSAIDELNYTPNMLGINLRKSQSGLILVLLTTISNIFYAEMVNGIADCAEQLNYNIMLGNTNGYLHKERAFCEIAKSKLADGIIFTSSVIDEKEINEYARNVPAVLCGGNYANVNVPLVVTNDVQASYEAVKYLIDLGHRKIGFIGSDILTDSASIGREKGYRKALNEASIIIDDTWIARCPYDFTAGLEGTKALLTQHPDMDAIFCMDDICAFNAIKMAKEMHIRVPEDLSVVGFDDSPYALLSSPTITTVRQQGYQLGYYAMKTLYEQSQIKESLRNNTATYIKHELIIRQSTAPCKR